MYLFSTIQISFPCNYLNIFVSRHLKFKANGRKINNLIMHTFFSVFEGTRNFLKNEIKQNSEIIFVLYYKLIYT